MRVDPSGLAGRVLCWYGLLGAPFAWTVFHVIGVGIATGACSPWGVRGDAGAQPGSLILTFACVGLAFAALLAAVVVFISTRGAEEEGPPPLGRIHFLSVVGLAIAPLFIAIILMAGLGGTMLGCEQG
jgi:predicted branched-subunit amino acid permease